MGTITGYTAAHMQEIVDATIVDGSIVNDELVLLKHNGDPLNVGNVTSEVGGSNVVSLRPFHRYLPKADTETVDVVCCADSTGEGWTSDGTDDNIYFNRLRKNAASMFNGKNKGRYGRQIVAGSGVYGKPRFTQNGTGASEANSGLALRTRVMAATSPEAVLSPTVMDGVVIRWYKINIFAAAHGYFRVMALTGVTTTTTATSLDLSTNPTTIAVTSTANLSSSGYVVLTNNLNTCWAIVQYTGVSGGNTLTGCTMRSQDTFASGSSVEQATVAVSNEVTGYDSGLPASTKDLQEWYSGLLPRGRYVVGIAQKTSSSFNGAFQFASVYCYDGDRSVGIRFHNASHFGYNFSHYYAYDDPNGFGPMYEIRKNFIVPRLWIWAHGINEGVDTAALETHMRAAIALVWDAQDDAGQPHCAQALVVPYCSSSKTEAAWAAMRAIYYKVGLELGVAVWDWSELTGPVSTVTGDPLGWTVDNIHPGDNGHRAIGDWLTTMVFRGATPGAGLYDVENNLAAIEFRPAIRQLASYTLQLTDQSALVEINNGSANNLTIPPNSSVPFPIGTVIECAQYGAGTTTVVAGAGVTIRSRGAKVASAGQYACWRMKKIGTDEWYLYGDLA